MIKDIARGMAYLARGFSLIKSKGIKRYVVLPLSLNILLFGGLIWFGYAEFGPLVDRAMSYVPNWLGFLQNILWFFIVLLTAIIVFFTFSPIANIIAAPFNAVMAEKIEQKLTGHGVNVNVSLMTIIKDSILSQIGKLFYILAWSILLFIISIVPLLNFISPFLWILFGSWLLSLEYLDYPMGNHALTFRQEKKTLKKRRGLALGFGGGVMALTSIPVVNFIVMPIAVAGATAMWVDHLSKDFSQS